MVLRTQAQAEYSPENIGHFGLNLRRYAHFTSPIRRYADLIVHRALIARSSSAPAACRDARGATAGDRRRRSPPPSGAPWRPSATPSTGSSPTGSPTASAPPSPGRISGVTRAGLFVKLDDTGADGFVPMRTLGGDYFHYDEARHAVIGARTGEMHRLGDAVEVRLVEAVPLAGALRFELLERGPRPAAQGAAGAPKRAAGGRAGTAATTRRAAPPPPPRHAATRDLSLAASGLLIVDSREGDSEATMPVEITHPTRKKSGRASQSVRRGFSCRCPHCGEGKLFRAFLKPVDACPVCGEDLSHQRADDFPPYITMVIVGHILVPLMLTVQMLTDFSVATYLAIYLPITVARSSG